MLSWDDFDKNEEIKKEEPVQNKVIEKSVIEKTESLKEEVEPVLSCLLYTSPSPRDLRASRMPSSA